MQNVIDFILKAVGVISLVLLGASFLGNYLKKRQKKRR